MTQGLTIKCVINEKPVELEVNHIERLLDVLRVNLKLTGTKEGCGEGECGACAVLVDGQLVNSCLMPIQHCQGVSIMTVEGLEHVPQLSSLQNEFIRHNAAQCGYCTPGMLMAASQLLLSNPHPTREEIRSAIAGNLCRCTGYNKIVDAISGTANLDSKEVVNE